MTAPDDLSSGIAEQHGRAKALTVALGICVGLYVLRLGSAFMQLDLLGKMARGVDVPHEAAVANDARQGLLAAAGIVALLATAILCLVWLHRAYANLKLMGSKQTEITPGWAVGYWFIPFVNLFRPYMTVKELWQRSATGNAAGDLAAAPALIGLWWAAYVAAGFTGRAATMTSSGASQLQDLSNSTMWSLASNTMLVFAGIFLIMVVRQIDAAQRKAAVTVVVSP